MKTNLGKVAITPKGAWNSTTAYTALDTVNFGGGSWLAKRGNIAVTPTEGDDWMQLSAKGADAELTKDSIVSALGYTPERDYGNYELIESITTTEEVAALETTGAFKALFALITSPGTSANIAANITVTMSEGKNMYCYETYGIQAAKGRISACSVFMSDSRAEFMSWRAINAATYYAYAPNYTSVMVNPDMVIKSLIFMMTVPVGTSYEVYGIKA